MNGEKAAGGALLQCIEDDPLNLQKECLIGLVNLLAQSESRRGIFARSFPEKNLSVHDLSGDVLPIQKRLAFRIVGFDQAIHLVIPELSGQLQLAGSAGVGERSVPGLKRPVLIPRW
jgi:hypothetical protein